MSDFRVQPNRPTSVPGPETIPWFWNPNRQGVQFAPSWFMDKLHEVGRELSATWDPIHERWLIWMESPSFAHKICQGWKLLFMVRNDDGSYRPLDERVFARLYEASAMKWGNGKKYFAAIEREMQREREKQEAQSRQDNVDTGMPFYDYQQIKVSMAGKSNGSKFADYLS